MVRSNDVKHVRTYVFIETKQLMALLQTGDLVKDWRRMNVSFTRAQCKLVIFGSRSTLKQVQLLDGFFQLMQGNGWILQLPPGTEAAHRNAFAVENNDSMDVDKDALCLSTVHKPLKCHAEDDGDDEFRGKENDSLFENRARKNFKTAGINRSVVGIPKGRPILQICIVYN